MNIDPSRFQLLFQKHLEDTAAPEEIQELFDQIAQHKNDEQILSILEAELLETDSLNTYERQRWDLVLAKIKDDIDVIEEDIPVIKKRFSFLKAGIAAAIAFIVLGVYFFNYHTQRVNSDEIMAVQDVAPGKMGATLTLASGKKIRLSDAANGELAKEAGIKVSKAANGQLVYQMVDAELDSHRINTLTTEKGETYVLTLPDKSKVWLNAASSLTYSAGLNENGIRRVKLTGEAFFKVFKDKAHPFVVQTANQEVEVLGTEFNINSYPDEGAVATTLVDGSVKVSADGRQQVIVPGEQLSNNGTGFKVAKVNLDNVVDWKNGEFNLQGLPFRVAMRKIARWYDVEVIYDASVTDNIKSGGWISRDVKLSTILEGIERSKQVKFRLEGKKLYVSK